MKYLIGEELLPQQNNIVQSYALMTQDEHHDQYQFMCFQGVNSDSYSIEELQELLDI